ncbi:hypothetical protein [Fluviicola taffensis]|uniref:Uncharacterized protein n=1 Tax=Fluviicola taffensis (strain DSM 16823 / NCIMB 13979 / RW262) TaxID=755732 RepID=F2IDF8_FLUTR|nr:hypothetical protein [Fluviicola taffensis]AEA42334.1 hypothetical protein Fluta_0325 [Fluviicola taffensis DSM 16823]
MKKTTLSHMAMYQNVLAVVKDHQSSWSGIPGIVTVVDQFESMLNNLGSKMTLQSKITQGITLEKQAFIHELIEQMSLLKKGLFLYATQTNNLDLRARHKEAISTLKRLTEGRLQFETAKLLEDLQIHGSSLDTVGISSSDIQVFQNKVALLEERKNSVRQAIIERTIETKGIYELEKKLNDLLINQLDRFISFFQSTNNTFFATYKAARRIIGNSGGSKSNPVSAG